MENNSDILMNVHHGRNVKRMRAQKGIKQDALASELGMSQQNLSRLESKKEIDDITLERIAKILKVSFEDLKTMEEPGCLTIENNNNSTNTYTDNAAVTMEGVNNNLDENHSQSQPNFTNHVNPIDKITELYERLLQTSNDKIKQLEARIAELEGEKKRGE